MTSEASERLIGLLDYIEQVEKLKRKPAFTVPTDIFVACQSELKGLPGIEFSLLSASDDVWLKVPRLKEIAPPNLDEKLMPWVTLSKSPDREPELKREIVIAEGKKGTGEKQSIDDDSSIEPAFNWYKEQMWAPWAASERPRRKTIALYNKLFAVEQAIATDGTETPIELIWGIGLAVWKVGSQVVRHPLISQSCEIVLNTLTFDLEIRPRTADARLELDCYADLELSGVRTLEDHWKSVQAAAANRINPFEPSTFEGTLKFAVGHLDSNGSYVTSESDPVVPAPSDKLVITDTWVVFGRRRSDHIFVQDVQRLKQNVEKATSIPSVIQGLVQTGDDSVRAKAPVSFRGLSGSTSGTGVKELYFPMPYNDEQVSIVEKLETNDGIVVQGPPGTGKTHTIANVICHFLAQGKRVLVTAKGESALAVVKDKIPEQIRSLCVSLLTDEREGMRQFEHSVQEIATKVGEINPGVSERNIVALETRLNGLHAKLSAIDHEVAVFAEKHMRVYPFRGHDSTTEELARFVLENDSSYNWLDDVLDAKTSGKPLFDNDGISQLRRARIDVGPDIIYLGCSLPVTDAFPSWAELYALHTDLLQSKEIEGKVASGHLLPLADATTDTFEKARVLAKVMAKRASDQKAIKDSERPWSPMLAAKMANADPADPALLGLVVLLNDIDALDEERRNLLSSAISIPPASELNDEFLHAVERQCAGKSAFVLPFGKQPIRTLVASVTMMGIKPNTPEQWSLVSRHIKFLIESRKIIARWCALAPEFGIAASADRLSFAELVAHKDHIELVRQFGAQFGREFFDQIGPVFGRKVSERLSDSSNDLFELIQVSLLHHIDKGKLVYCKKVITELLGKLDGKSGPIVDRLSNFFNQSLGNKSLEEAQIQEVWHDLMHELRRVTSLAGSLGAITHQTKLIEDSGAVRWANRLRTNPATGDGDQEVPPDWLEAWNWRMAKTFLEKIDGHERLKRLFEERKTLEGDLAKTYQELISEKTWLGVHNNSPDSIRQALQSYLVAIQAMGAGTGVRAVRHRKDARTSMMAAYKAVPCWIMPQWRVSETLPPEVGLFDLVIIDEASQSDIWALPALLRGKKLLVVGDHKQVSPSAVGTAEVKIQELISRFLRDQPHGAQMTPDKSIYDLARVVFAGNSVMLKEHFRCVPAIIEYSNREFYQGDIKPLRLPKGNERLDPPLIDVFVKGGFRKGDVNDPEARAIVDEVLSILADETLDGRSIGIVTLLGMEQAAYINKLINAEIPPTEIVARRIAVGPPPVFQGRERDIMLTSMVLAPGDRGAPSRLEMEQRFNVAASRARDRNYLFRSVNEDAFAPDSLSAKLIRHFRQPFVQDAALVQDLRDRCESDFEREVFDMITKRNYRVKTQVPVGGYRIDMVVEGDEGRRLAIECDGDKYHGPGQWQADMTRQRTLERAGWIFWRCFASSFVMRRDDVLADLFGTLDKMGIAALGSESVDNTVWVTYKEADPYGVDNQEEAVEEAS